MILSRLPLAIGAMKSNELRGGGAGSSGDVPRNSSDKDADAVEPMGVAFSWRAPRYMKKTWRWTLFQESRVHLKEVVGYKCGLSNREHSLKCLRCVRNFGVARLFRRLCAASHWLKDLIVLSDVMNLIAKSFQDVFSAETYEQGFINVRQKKCFGWIPQLPPGGYPYRPEGGYQLDGDDSDIEWDCAAMEAGVVPGCKRKR